MLTTVLPEARRTTEASGAPRPGGERADRRAAPALAWLAVVTVALVWGTWRVADAGVGLRAAPLYGRWSWHPSLGLLPTVLVAVVVLAGGPTVAARCRWRRLPLVAGAAAMVWTVALAASAGWSGVTAPLASEHEYEPLAAQIGDGAELAGFVDGYVEHLREWPIHVQGHPPGAVLPAWGLDRVGLGGAGWLAAVAIAGWGVAVAAALVAAGEKSARRVAPALVLLPAAVWAGTSLDALFAGLAAITVAAGVRAARRSSVGWAALAGGMAGVALLCTYGASLVLLVGLAGAAAARPDRPLRLLASAASAAAVPLGLAALAGFWWPAGLAATGEAYWDGIASSRPAAYLTLVGNPAALALATGPAVAAGLWDMFLARRPRPCAPLLRIRAGEARSSTASGGLGVVLAVAALVGVVVADLSQMSRGEVERIWLPFVPWLALAAPGGSRRWLAVQVAVALALESSLVSAW